jgi:hypothetical protein
VLQDLTLLPLDEVLTQIELQLPVDEIRGIIDSILSPGGDDLSPEAQYPEKMACAHITVKTLSGHIRYVLFPSAGCFSLAI